MREKTGLEPVPRLLQPTLEQLPDCWWVEGGISSAPAYPIGVLQPPVPSILCNVRDRASPETACPWYSTSHRQPSSRMRLILARTRNMNLGLVSIIFGNGWNKQV